MTAVSKKAKARFIFFLISSFTIALVISLIIGACFFISLYSFEKTKTVDSYKLNSGYVDAKKTTKYVYSSDILRGGVMCVDFSDIAEFCAFTVVGDGDDIMFYFNNNDDDLLEITIGQNIAYVNRNPVNMPTSAYMVGDDIYLPFEFVSRFMEGVTLSVDEEKSTINLEYSDTVECSLKLKYPNALSPIDPETWVDPRSLAEN